MSRVHRHLVGAAALAACGMILSACSGGITAASFTTTPTTARGVTLSTESSPAGRILATPSGRTLYDFTPDRPTSSSCTSGLCVTLWPPLLTTTTTPKVATGLDQSLVSTIRRPDGRLQIAYAGRPLYSWKGDTTPGMITGQAILNVGGYWYVLAPTGRQITTAFRVTRSAVRRPASSSPLPGSGGRVAAHRHPGASPIRHLTVTESQYDVASARRDGGPLLILR